MLLFTLLFQTGRVYADLPDLGDIAEATMSLADEARIGRDAMRAMRQEGLVSDDAELTQYIHRIGARLAGGAQNPQLRFTFFVANDPGINAFAMPGGYIGVNKGLILVTQSEGELASVLGHEMAHVSQRHLARMRANTAPNQLMLLGTLVAAALASRSGNSDMVFGSLYGGIGLTISTQLSFSRDFEREADRVGMQYLAAAGFDSREMPSFFQRLQQSEHLNGGDAYAFLRTHPVTSERISEAQNRSEETPVRMRASSTDYLLVREKIRSQIMEPTEALKYYQNALTRGLYLSRGATSYGLARVHMQLGHFSAARQALADAQRQLPPNPMLLGLEIEIERQAQHWSAALALYRSALQIYPNDSALADGEIDLLLLMGELKPAQAAIKQQQEITPDDPALYRLLARTYVDRDALRYHAALGNALYFEQWYEAALEQYHLASQASGDDFYLRSAIEARARELETILSEDKNGASKGSLIQ